MIEFYIGWITLTLIVCALAGIILWSDARKLIKVFAVIFMVASAPLVLHLSKMTAGQSVECDLSIRREILEFKIDAPMIYLWLNSVKPIYCHTPYSGNLAEKLVMAKLKEIEGLKNGEQELEMMIEMQAGEGATVDLEIPEYEVPEKTN